MARSRDGDRTGRRRRLAAAKQLPDTFVKGMSNALRVQVWTILTERAASAKEISDEIGVPFEKVNYQIKELAKIGVIEKVGSESVRGAVKTFYKAVTRASLDEAEWLIVPDEVKGDLRATLLQTITDDALEAITASQYDARSDAHMSWTALLLDEQGCVDIAQILIRALEEILDVQANSMERLAAEDAEGISYTTSILGYTSAHEGRKVGPPRSARQLVSELSDTRIHEFRKKRQVKNPDPPAEEDGLS
jgi:DNA-binding Lrp family transcriptional regulator